LTAIYKKKRQYFKIWTKMKYNIERENNRENLKNAYG